MRIDQIQSGDEIASLDEATGRMVWSKVNALMDMGVKTTYRLRTADGREIRTTATHPYLVRGIGSRSAKHPSLIAGAGWLTTDAIKAGDYIAVPKPRLGVFIDDANMFYAQKKEGWRIDYAKLQGLFARSFDVRFMNYYLVMPGERDTAFQKTKQFLVPFMQEFGAVLTLRTKPLKYIFDRQKKEWTKKGNVDSELLIDVLARLDDMDAVAIVSGDSDYKALAETLARKGKKVFFAAFENNMAWELRQMKHVYLNRIKSAIALGKEKAPEQAGVPLLLSVYSPDTFLSSGDVEDNFDDMVWAHIQSIETVGEEQVYDIEVEGTHNFIGNDIVAHNTYITGGLGVGQAETTAGNITGTGRLSITSTAATSTFSTGGLAIGTSQFVVQQTSGNTGIGAANPIQALHLVGSQITTGDHFIYGGDINLGTGAATSTLTSANGNLGIGTTSPSQLFAVHGNSYVSGASFFGGSITATSTLTITTTTATSTFTGGLSVSGGGLASSNGLTLTGGSLRSTATATSTFDAGLSLTHLTATNGLTITGGTLLSSQPFNLTGTATSSTVGGIAITAGGGLSSANGLTLTGGSILHTGALPFSANGSERMRIATDGNVGIGTTGPGALLHGIGQNGTILFQDVATDATTKTGRYGAGHYTNAEEPFYGLFLSSGATTNILFLGGGTGAGNAATEIRFNTAANNTTLTGTQRMVIDSSGNVGIGTTSPIGLLALSGTGSASVFKGLVLAGDQYNGFAPTSAVTIGSGGAAGDVLLLTAPSAIRILTGTTATERVRIDSSGNVGIGTTGPQELLHVGAGGDSSFSGAIDLIVTRAGASGLSVRDSTNDVEEFMYVDSGGGIVGTGTNHDMFLRTNNANVMTLKTSGNVGIGTTGPEVALHVNGTSAGALLDVLKVDNASGAANTEVGLVFENGVDRTARISSANEAGDIGPLKFWTAGSIDTLTERMRITSAGNVGIGTTNPLQTLHVAGTMRLTTSVAVTDDRTLCTIAASGEIEIKDGACGTSSLRYKENIQGIGYGLAEVNKLNPVFFNYLKDSSATSSLSMIGDRTKRKVGFIAEEVNEIIPEVVMWQDGQVDGIDYAYLTALLTKGMQEFSNALDITHALTGTSTLHSFYAGTTTPALTIDANGNIGIGTTSPDYLLRVEGDVAARSFVNISTRTAKKDIVQIDGAGEEKLLQALLSATTTRYKYTGDAEGEEHLGLIAEEAPEAIKSANGKGIDLYKMATALLAGMKAQERKIEQLDSILRELGTTNAWSVDQQSGRVTANFLELNLNGASLTNVKKITSSLGTWSIDEDGTLMAVRVITDEVITKKLKAQSATFGSPEKPEGITIYDEATKQPGCVRLVNGALQATPGECGVTQMSNDQTAAEAPAVTSEPVASSTSVTDETTATSTPVTTESTATTTTASLSE